MMSDLTTNSILVLVPAYNAAKYLPELIERLEKFVCRSNLLFVNDGSSDNTESILNDSGVTHINFKQNQGKGAALKAGFNYAVEKNYRSVLTIDADLQHPPENIPSFYAIDDGRTFILGTRDISLSIMPFARWLTNNLTSLIISIFSTQRVRDSQSGYRLIPTSFLRSVPMETIKYDLESEMLFKAGAAGYKIAEVPIATIYEGSHSYINPFKDSGRFVRQIWKRIWS
jgi:glycosyltransferase involved in cell wall biosynthesis